MLQNLTAADTTGTVSESDLKGDYISELLEALKNATGGKGVSSMVDMALIDITA